ncbi:hypothetical protein BC829DRAFT_436373 [Chytridium lagenaria]|nr:hypothetical protein BC829DRAFT_436373 [Chytridium lagenaria]
MSGHLHQLVLGLGRTMYALSSHACACTTSPEPSSTALLQEEEASLPSTSKNEPHPIPPVIVVTNPRDARFASPSREPIHRILSSTHIRILIYSRSTVASSNITITIDGNSVMKGAYRAAGSEFHPAWPAKLPLDSESSVNHLPLWVAPWNPTLYADGIDHIMKVEVMDGEGGKTIKMVVFRVDGNRSRKQMGLAKSGTLILSVRFPLLFQTLFAFAHFFITIILLLLPGLVVTHHRSDGTLAGLRGSIIRRLRWLDSLLERFNEGKPWIKIMQCCRKPHLRAGTSSLDDDEDLMSGLGIGVAANGSGWWWSGSGDGVQESSAIGARAEEAAWYILSFFSASTSLTSFLGILGTLCERWLLTLWYGLLALADTPSLYYPLYIFSLQSAIGPWFFGDFVSSASLWWPNRYGILFTVGIWFGMGKGWIPLADSWIYSLWLVSLVLFPIVLYMSMLASRRTGWMHSRMSGSPSIVLRILLVVFIFYTLKDGIIMGYSYGWISVVTGSRIWWTLWAAFEMARRWVNRMLVKSGRRRRSVL